MRVDWMILVAAGVAVTGCRDSRATAEKLAEAANTTPVDSSEPMSDGVNRSASRELPPNIYYDLTRYEWYAQGKPLIHEGQTYQPAGMPVTIELANLNHLGEFEGVDYYEPKVPDEHGMIYVPVFEGYWLPFGPTAPIGIPAND